MIQKGRFIFGLTALLLMSAWSLQAAEPRGLGLQDNTMEGISKKVFDSVVKVETRNGFRKVATGVVIDKDGYIVTTGLIWTRNEEIVITTADGKRSEAKFLGMDSETHLALIQANEKNLTPIVLGKAAGLSPGSWIGVVSVSPENAPQVTQGIVSSVTVDKMRLNVWVTRGASGSPVVNKDGQMVALLRGIYSEDQPVLFEFREQEVVGSGYVFNTAEAPSSGMALGIPVELVKTISSEIREKGRVSRGWVGIGFSENENGQVEVSDVEKDSPAELAKIQEGDILVSIDGKKVAGAPMVVSEIRNGKPGQDVKFELNRDGKTVEVKVKLGEYPEVEARRELEARFPRLFPTPPTAPAAPAPAITPRPEKAPRPPKALIERSETWPGWEKRKYIGTYMESLNKELLEFFGVKEESGLLVNRLTKDGPAEKAGVKVGDVVVRVDGEKVATVGDLSEFIQDKKKGDKVKLEIIRDKKPLTLEVEISEEEGPSLSDIYLTEPSREAWGEVTKELQRQYDRSRDTYEKYNETSRDKLKKLNEELLDKSQESYEKARGLFEESRDKVKLRRMLSGKNKLVFRA
jgi:S1-C subfamily serine protease